jgi:tyrocidine synthetase-3
VGGNEMPKFRGRDISSEKNRQEAYWQETFSGEIPVLEMPTDYIRPAVKETAGDYVTFSLDNEFTYKLQELAMKQSSTLDMILLATYTILLSRYSGQEDIVVGLLASGTHSDFKRATDAVNNLALRNYPLAEKSFDSFLEEVQDRAIQAYDYQDYPFERLVEKLEIEEDPSRSPLFDVMFVMQNIKQTSNETDGITVHTTNSEYSKQTTCEFDLTLVAIETDNGLRCSLKYRTSLFKKETMQRLAGHFGQILEHIVEQPAILLKDIDLLTTEEKQQIIVDFNNTQTAYPKDKTIHCLFEKHVEKTPNHVAVILGEEQLTYRELNEKANQLARVLRSKGVQADRIVGIMVERSLEMMIGILGILKAGGVYLPIDPDYPEERIQYVLEDSQTCLLLSQKHLHAASFDGEVLLIDDQQLYRGDTSNLGEVNQSNDLAYVMYTSGSTGKPKGNLTTHFNITRVVKNTNYVEISAKDTIIQLSNYAFDGSTFDIFGAFLNGATLVVVNKDQVLDMNQLSKVLHTYQSTVFFMTAALFNMLVDTGLEHLNNIRQLIVGGDKLSVPHVRKALDHMGPGRIINGYGPTESTVFTACYAINEVKGDGVSIPIGKPVSNTQVYILDKHQQLLPIGVPGELYISGDGLARGYLNRPDLTAEKFVDHPYLQGEKMYKSGDIARWLPDGSIEFIGRLDHQVKIRGFRIELGEIEQQLMKNKAIKETVVMDRIDSQENKYLCAYIVADEEIMVDELREQLSKELPDYMIPSFYVQLEKMPLTSNGKTDRKALPEPDGNLHTGTEYVAPKNKVEENLAWLWSDVLGVKKIGAKDNFFTLGGHSLRATLMVSKLYKEFGVVVPISEIFKRPTIQGLANYIQGSERREYISIEAVEEREYYPVSSAQKRQYIIHEIEGANINYNLPSVFEMTGNLDKERLEKAFSALVQRHESLRTTFDSVEGEPVQRVHREVDFAIAYRIAGEEEMTEIVSSFIRPFDLHQGPLLRVELVSVAENRHFFLLDMHHIISDGVSMDLVIKDVMSLYEEQELPVLRIQYKDFAIWEKKQFATDEIKKQEAYWQETLSGAPVLEMPTDYTRPAVKETAGDRISFTIDSELTSRLQKMAKHQGATLYMVLLAAYNVLLSRYSGQEDIVVGSPIAGRRHADVEHTVGMFVNTLAFRNYPSPDQSFASFLEEVKEQALQVYEHQDYPFEILVESLDIQRDTSRNPLFDVVFALQNMEQATLEIDGLTLNPCSFEYAVSKFDLTLEAIESDEGLRCNLEYRTKLFKRETVERLMGHFKQVICQIVEQPNLLLKDIELLTVEEKHQLMVDFNDTKVEYPKEKTLHELFEEQVTKTPDNMAVVFGEEQLTYKELNERANQLARVLRSKGVQDEEIVGIMVEPSLEMIIGIFAILKAGGAYLPIDSKYPEERIQYLLQDSQANLLLTQHHLCPAPFKGEVIYLEDKELYIGDDSNIGIVKPSQDLAYVIYTSGTTGNPKGVMVEHRSVVNMVNFYIQHYALTAKDSAVKYAGFGFDASVWEVFPNMLAGATLHMIQDNIRLNIDKLNEYLERHRITICFLPTQMSEQFMEIENKSLRLLLIGGDKLKHYIPRKYEVSNNYGPTENTVVTTVYTVKEQLSNVPIGKPIANNQVYILGRQGRLQPIGVSGELCIAGEGLVRGYLNRPELTAEKFVENPFRAGEKMYKTGDVARWLPDGNIEFLGRVDHQVKIRGYRIELGEIEHQMLKHSTVKEAVVVDRMDPQGDKYLCAYIIVDQETTIEELRVHLSKTLPEYMIPSAFVQLKEMPLTPNGKIDRKGLPEPDGSVSTGIEYIAPRNNVEEPLAKLWSDVLGMEVIGVQDNFFSSGGHSLKATLMVSKLHKEMGVNVSLRDVFERPTIQDLAKYIQDSEEKDYVSIEVVEEREYYPVSSAQKRQYILQQFEGENFNYNLPSVFEMNGVVDKKRLEEAFRGLVHRHDSLRTTFDFVEGELVQRVHQELDFAIDSREAREEELAELVTTFIRPFDLNQGPLLRVELVSITENRHIFLLDMHHIVSDGVSMDIVIRDVMSLYEREELPDLRIQYKDFTMWEKQQFATGGLKNQEAFWLETFSGEVPVLAIPTDYTRPVIKETAGERINFTFDGELTSKLQEFAQQQGVTLFMVLLAAYNVLLSRYSGQEDIVVGSPIAGRRHPDLENTVGMFVNTLALRNYPVADQSFAAFLEEVKEHALQVYEHQDYPFEMLVEKLDIQRDTSRSPMFDVMFVLQNMENTTFEIEGLTMNPYSFAYSVSKFDLSLIVMETDEDLKCSFEYRTKLFKKETIERLMGHFRQVIDQIIEQPNLLLKEIELLTIEERQQLLIDFNATQVDYSKNKTIHELFEEQVTRMPDNIAVVFEEEQLTYKELNEKANQLARVLRAKGVQSDEIVGIMVERSLEMMIGIIGIMKAGGAYLPIDPAYPTERIEYVLKDSQAQLILTQQHLSVPDFDGEVIALNDEELYKEDNTNLKNVNVSQDLAYVIYTSGSTGNPKGVMVEHKSIINLTDSLYSNIYQNYEQQVKVGLLASYVFDASVQQIFATLLYGNQLYIVPDRIKADGELLIQYLIQKEVEVSDGTPAHLRLLTQTISAEDNRLKLKHLLIGGEVLLKHTLKDFMDCFKGNEPEIINVYGPTECTVDSTLYSINLQEYNDLTTVPIGKPLNNVNIYILNKISQLVPIGVPGELCVSGEGLARGYLNRPELTAEKFVEHPFHSGEKIYKTGDVARWLPDGSIEYLGRLDDQVKIRGYRIEIGEIEEQMLRHEAVKEVAVVDRIDSHGETYLCAYLVTVQELTIGDLRNHLSQILPEYMIPSSFVQLEEMPLTLNGKIDRKALPEPDGSLSTGTEFVAPRNKVEETLVDLWSTLLGIKKIGVQDNFFTLGGHSLKATLMVSRLYKEMGVEVPLREVFQRPTIQDLALYIESLDRGVYVSIEAVEKREYYPVSSAQKRLYILQQFEGANISYNIPSVFEMKGILDKERLEEALKALIKRHDSLRTSFDMVEDDPVQRVHPEVDFAIVYREAKEEEMGKIVTSFIRPFDLHQGPLLRVELVSVAENQHFFLLDMHHIISDGVSMDLVIKEIMSLYEGEELPDLRIQYKDFSIWEREQFATDELKRQEAFWQKTFSGEVPVLEMPTDYTRPTIKELAGDCVTFTIDSELTSKLQGIAKQQGATLYMALLAAYNVLLSRYSGQEDIVVGSPIAGRRHPDVEQIVGMFVNTLAMRNYPVAEQSFTSFLEEVKEHALQVYENQDYPFEMLVEKLDIQRDTSRNPIFDVVFVLQNMEQAVFEIEGLTLNTYSYDYFVSKFDLTLAATETNEGLQCSLEYRTKLFTRETMERLAGHFRQVIGQIVQQPNILLKEIDFLTVEEKQQLLVDFNDTQTEYPKDKTLQQLFEEQVTRTPDKVAAFFEEEHLTYKELNEKANQLARVLRSKGVQANEIVGILVERSLEMVIGIFGILKAGGAYLPIDPDYPEERIQYVLEDSQTSLLLSQKHIKGASFNGEVLYIDDQQLYTGDKTNIGEVNQSQNLAYVMYTSGSTGKQKGNLTTHFNITRVVKNTNYIEITPEDTFLQLSNYAFDGSTFDMFGAFLNGATLVIVHKDQVLDMDRFSKVLHTYENTVFFMTSALFNMLVDTGVEHLNNIRQVIVGGDKLSVPHVRKALEHLGQGRIINGYGPTENTVFTACYEINEVKENGESIPIGKPISNTQVYIIDKHKKLLPIGVPGELCISGDGLAMGYLNRPELTAEKFVEHPFLQGEKMYKSGDIARWLPDGNIEFIGRLDHQVKIRGFRIELGEIEQQLVKHHAIRETVIMDRVDSQGQKYLSAYFVADEEVNVEELRAQLSQELPDYMIPSFFVQLKQLPLTSNGKTDRKALPEPDRSIYSGGGYVAPRNEVEEKLAQIWSQVLDVEKVGVEDDFFTLGGHSLKAIQIVSKINKEFSIEMNLGDIFKTSTIQGLTQLISKSEYQAYNELEAVNKMDYYALSHAQKRIWFAHQLSSDRSAYNIPDTITLFEKYDGSLIKKVFQEIINRHESLRTRFEAIDGNPVQIVDTECNFEVEFTDLYELSEDESETQNILQEEFGRPFNLECSPLLRVKVFKCNENKFHLTLVIHHIVYDGLSSEIVRKEFFQLYESYKDGVDLKLPPLKYQYKDFSHWQNQLISTGKMEEHRTYWLNKLSGELPVLNLPKYDSYSGSTSQRVASFKFSLSKSEREHLVKITEKYKVTLFTVLLASFKICLSRLTEQRDIIVGTPTSGRENGDVEDIVGCFINTTMLRTKIDLEERFEDLILRVQEDTLEALKYQGYPFDLLVDELNIERKIDQFPISSVFFNLINFSSSDDVNTPDTMDGPVQQELNYTGKFDLNYYIRDDQNRGFIEIDCHYNVSMFERDTIEYINLQYTKLLKFISKEPTTMLRDITIFKKASSSKRKRKVLG